MSIIDFDIGGLGVGRKGSGDGAWVGGGDGGGRGDRLMVNGDGGLIDLLAVCDGRLAVGERSSNVVWKVDMDGGWGGGGGEGGMGGRGGVGSGGW